MGTNYNRKLFSNFIALSIVQGTNFLLPLLVMPYMISKIGADGFGVIAIAQVMMIYLSAIADYGFNLTATKDIVLHRDDQLKISRIFFTVLATRLLITAFLFILLLIAIAFIPVFKEHFILYSLAFTYVIGQSLFVSWFFQGMEKMHYITISTLISRLIFVTLVLLFIHRKEDGIYFLFFLGIGNMIAGLFSFFIAIRIFKLTLLYPARADIKHELKEGWQVTISNLSISTYLYAGIFILRIFTNDTVVGYYSIAERIFFAVRQVLAVFSQVVYPHICQLSQKSKEAANIFFKMVYLPFLLLTLAGCGLLFILSPQVINIFLKEPSPLAVVLLRMLSFLPVIVCLNIPAYQLLVAFDRKKSYVKIFGLATIINISINILLVNDLGASGTALSIIITELFITTGLNRELYKNKLGGYLMTET
ncbi:MAG: oligosaccharide flippase family protein [Chitinophagaceae bacterium]